MEKVNVKKYLLKLGFIVSIILFVLPSIMFFFRNGNTTFVRNTLEYKFLLVDNVDGKYHFIGYLGVLILMILFYTIIIKKHKELFRSMKEIYKFIIIISIICIFSVPFMSSDVYYYLGTGRLASKYKQNPYYTDIKSYIESNDISIDDDSVMETGYINYWSNTTVVYGAVWSLICTGVAFFSFGSLNAGILIFKILNVLIHIFNCILLYKISKKKIFPLLYGLNPFVLIEGIVNVHNDIYMVFFILLALYLVCKKKKLTLGLFCLAMATDVKYVAALLLPILIIYHYREEKFGTRLLKCVQYGLIFVFFAIIPYGMYIRDFEVFKGIATQQSRYAKGLYCYLYVLNHDSINLIKNIREVLLFGFIILYSVICARLLTRKKIIISKELRKMYALFFVFLVVLLTNFQPWYFIWLSALLVWQNAQNIKLINQVQIVTLIANAVFVMYSESYWYAKEFFEIFVIGTWLCMFTNMIVKVYKMRKAEAKSLKN